MHNSWLEYKKGSMSLSERFYPPPSLKIALDVEKRSKKYLKVKAFLCDLQYFLLTLPKLPVLSCFFLNSGTKGFRPPTQWTHSLLKLSVSQSFLFKSWFRYSLEKSKTTLPETSSLDTGIAKFTNTILAGNILTQVSWTCNTVTSSLPSLFQLSLFQILWTRIPENIKHCLRAEKPP